MHPNLTLESRTWKSRRNGAMLLGSSSSNPIRVTFPFFGLVVVVVATQLPFPLERESLRSFCIDSNP